MNQIAMGHINKSIVFTIVFLVLAIVNTYAQAIYENKGLVGRWEFNDELCKDLSGNKNHAILNGTHIYSLANNESCIQFMPHTGPVTIPVSENSPLAISQGTICFWLNVGTSDPDILSFNNGAVDLKIYRGDFQVRFKGEDKFNYGSGILDYNWPLYDMREWAFYGHPRSAIHDSRWHHFTVAYDNDGSVIEDISYKNIKMTKTYAPIFIKVSDVARVPEGSYNRGSIRNISFENITASDCYSELKESEMGSVIWGKPESPIENIHFKNVSIKAKGDHPVTEAEIKPAENNEYFPRNLGIMPAYSWYLRHVNRISFTGCEFSFEKSDGRPAFVIDDASNILIDKTLLPVGSRCSSRINILHECKNIVIKDCKGFADRNVQSAADRNL